MTPVIDLNSRGAIEAEAQAWIVRLDGGNPSREDLQALREWVGRSPQHRVTLSEMAALWGDLDGLAALEPILAASPDVRAAAERNRSVATPGRIWAGAGAAIAAVCLAVVGLGYWMWTANSVEAELYATDVGEQRQVALADGSQVTLNTDTAIEVAYERGARRIRLIEGEALFDVAEDENRPFVVTAQRSAVRAVGTQFVVRIEPELLSVTVSEGVVAVVPDIETLSAAEPASYVSAGHAATLTRSDYRMFQLDSRDLERRLAWSRGLMIFEGQKLSDVLAEATRYTDLQFEIADEELRDLEIGGRFQIDEIEALLDALSASFGVTIERQDGFVRLSRPEAA